MRLLAYLILKTNTMTNKYILTSITILFSLLMSTTIYAQSPVELQISHKLNGSDFAYNKAAKNNIGNDFSVTRLEYYISNISITHDGGMVTPINNHYILVDASQNVMEDLGSYNITNVESISFYIGVDTPNNHADPSLQPNGHPLAPKSPSMHWGWTAGYRFVAMEGNCGAGLSQTFQIHALGDNNYLKTTINVSGTSQGGKIIIPIFADYALAIKDIDVSTGAVFTHGSTDEAAYLLGNFNVAVFYPGFPVSVGQTATKAVLVNVAPNPTTTGAFSINFAGMDEAAQIAIYDVQGRLVSVTNKEAKQQLVSAHVNQPGLYFVNVTTATGITHQEKVVVQ